MIGWEGAQTRHRQLVVLEATGTITVVGLLFRKNNLAFGGLHSWMARSCTYLLGCLILLRDAEANAAAMEYVVVCQAKPSLAIETR